ncbi:MAG: hypothetical protein EX272_14470 [Chromatiales bacterium]|nr:MAG: hypothetical protein EX272_14470 [Chromatiales bacterium]
MKSRAELLAEIEENRLINRDISSKLKDISLMEREADGGYNPYNNPGLGKELPDGADITARRREIMRRRRKS